jgi:hypothetical protein
VTSRVRFTLALAAAVLLLAAAGAWFFERWALGRLSVLVVEDARRGAEILRRPVRPGDRFRLSYLHSVSRTRVAGLFEVTPEGGLIVRETSFGTFGPGLPEPAAGERYEIREGAFHLAPDQRLADLSVFVHPYTEHRLEIQGEAVELSRALPAGTLVRISVRRSSQ